MNNFHHVDFDLLLNLPFWSQPVEVWNPSIDFARFKPMFTLISRKVLSLPVLKLVIGAMSHYNRVEEERGLYQGSISFVPYLCAIAQSNHLIYHGINLVSHGKKTRIPRLQQRRMSLHCFVLKTNYYIVPKQLFGKKWVKKGLRLFLRKKLLRLTRCLRSTIVT